MCRIWNQVLSLPNIGHWSHSTGGVGMVPPKPFLRPRQVDIQKFIGFASAVQRGVLFNSRFTSRNWPAWSFDHLQQPGTPLFLLNEASGTSRFTTSRASPTRIRPSRCSRNISDSGGSKVQQSETVSNAAMLEIKELFPSQMLTLSNWPPGQCFTEPGLVMQKSRRTCGSQSCQETGARHNSEPPVDGVASHRPSKSRRRSA